MLTIIILWGLALAVMCAVVSAAAARAKNRWPGGWVALALVFGPFALALIAVAPTLPVNDPGWRLRDKVAEPVSP